MNESASLTAGAMHPNSNFQVYTDGGMLQPHDPFSVPDGGLGAPDADAAADPASADPSAPPDPGAQTAVDPSAPPPAFPPPPMDPPEPTEAPEPNE